MARASRYISYWTAGVPRLVNYAVRSLLDLSLDDLTLESFGPALRHYLTRGYRAVAELDPLELLPLADRPLHLDLLRSAALGVPFAPSRISYDMRKIALLSALNVYVHRSFVIDEPSTSGNFFLLFFLLSSLLSQNFFFFAACVGHRALDLRDLRSHRVFISFLQTVVGRFALVQSSP